MHINFTVGVSVALIAVIAIIAAGIGAQAERRAAEKKRRKLQARQLREQAKIERRDLWQSGRKL
jgi:hypothetical protein